jgi:hypothetical protein
MMTASVFRVKEKGKQVWHAAAGSELLLVPCLAYYSALKRKMIRSSNLHSITIQNILFAVTAVRISNPTWMHLVLQRI